MIMIWGYKPFTPTNNGLFLDPKPPDCFNKQIPTDCKKIYPMFVSIFTLKQPFERPF